jgi:hypothetical protein
LEEAILHRIQRICANRFNYSCFEQLMKFDSLDEDKDDNEDEGPQKQPDEV